MEGDAVSGRWTDIADCPPDVIDRLRHYFLTYKDLPGTPEPRIEITHLYGRDEAHDVIERSRADYRQLIGEA